MSRADTGDHRHSDDDMPLDDDPTREAEAGATGAMAAGVTGATTGQAASQGPLGGLGGALIGQIVSRDLIDEQVDDADTSQRDADTSPDDYAVGGATSGGTDR